VYRKSDSDLNSLALERGRDTTPYFPVRDLPEFRRAARRGKIGVRHRGDEATNELTAMASSPAVHIIDDDDAVRESMAILLETHGFAVASYDSAEAFLRRHAQSATGCVVTDVQMAETNGLELLRTLKRVDPQLPVIVITARADPALSARAIAHGAVALIEKPFAAQAFLDAIRAALAEPDPA